MGFFTSPTLCSGSSVRSRQSLVRSAARGHATEPFLRMHHVGYLTADHTGRMSSLFTVCAKCHTPGNHKVGGKLYGLKSKLKPFKGATSMTAVRWDMIEKLKRIAPAWSFTSAASRQPGNVAKRLDETRRHRSFPRSVATWRI